MMKTLQRLLPLAVAATISGCATVDNVTGDCKSLPALGQDVFGAVVNVVSGSFSTCEELVHAAKKKRGISDDQGLIIHRVTRNPGNARRGRKLELSMCYEVYGFKQAILVTERREVVDSCDDGTIDAVEEKHRRINGAYESTFAFTVPNSWQPGSYYITQQIDSPQARASEIERLPLKVL